MSPIPATAGLSARSAYQASEDFIRLKFDLPEMKNSVELPQMLFVVDQSTSMRSSYHQVKRAVEYMLFNLGEHHVPSFILYNTTAHRASPQDVLNSGVMGATSFVAAFEEVEKFVKSTKLSTKLSVVFMTDGQDTASSSLNSGTTAFSSFVSSCEREVVIHTIGFSTGHDRRFLDKLRVMGSEEGVYRYAEGVDLEEKLEELFDFLQGSSSVEITLGQGRSSTRMKVDAGRDEHGRKHVDTILKRATVDPTGKLLANTDDVLHVSLVGTTGPCELELLPCLPDMIFNIRAIDVLDISSKCELQKAQKIISSINPFKAPRIGRQELMEARAAAQARLDKYHELFANSARGNMNPNSVGAQLSSLRFEARFSSARRARAMHKRAAANAGKMDEIETKLTSLAVAQAFNSNSQLLDGLPEIHCVISGDSLREMLTLSHRDVMVFGLRVRRPEHIVDAPTQIGVEAVQMGGVYSNEAWRCITKYRINAVGASTAHGGFDKSRRGGGGGDDNNSSEDEVQQNEMGLFRGADGNYMNGCLPLYLGPAHWARVRHLLQPMLGYFFTLDPLGYKPDQLVALYAVLGHMLSLQARGLLRSNFGTWIIGDFTQLCAVVRPAVMACLASGQYTGVVRGNLLEEFLASPAGRTKHALSSLLIMVGWHHADQWAHDHDQQQPERKQAWEQGGGGECGGGDEKVGSEKKESEEGEKYVMAMTEELWRRALGAYYKHHREEEVLMVVELLLFGPSAAGEVAEVGAVTALEATTTTTGDGGGDSGDEEQGGFDGEWCVLGEGEEEEKEADDWEGVVSEPTTAALCDTAPPLPPAPVLLDNPPVPPLSHAPTGESASSSSQVVVRNNKPKHEAGWELWAQLQLGLLSKRRATDAATRFQDGPPAVEGHEVVHAEGNDMATGGGPGFTPRTMAAYEEHPVFFDELVSRELGKIRRATRFFGPLLFRDGHPIGADGRAFSPSARRMLLLQALTFSKGASMKAGVAGGTYKNTWDHVGSEEGHAKLVESVLSRLEVARERRWEAVVRARNEVITAKRILLTKSPLAFAGRLMVACPTRGGGVFNAMMGLLGSGEVDGVPIPLIGAKVGAVLTGKLTLVQDGPEYEVHAQGQCWVTCPLDLAGRLRQVVGEEMFIAIELSMHGEWGWVYRQSDKPNRHGHCNSNPNPNLSGRFAGFGLK